MGMNRRRLFASLFGGVVTGSLVDVQPKPIQGVALKSYTPPPTTINITINAMDSQSFLDNSDKIAEALKKALQENHSILGVIRSVV